MSHLTGQNIVTWQQPAAWKAEKCRQDSEWPYVQFYYYLKKKKGKGITGAQPAASVTETGRVN